MPHSSKPSQLEMLQQRGAIAHPIAHTVVSVVFNASIIAHHAGLLILTWLSLPIALASMQLLMATLILPSTKLSLMMVLVLMMVHTLPTEPMMATLPTLKLLPTQLPKLLLSLLLLLIQ